MENFDTYKTVRNLTLEWGNICRLFYRKGLSLIVDTVIENQIESAILPIHALLVLSLHQWSFAKQSIGNYWIWYYYGSQYAPRSMFFWSRGAGSAVPREGFDLSVIILASLLVFPMLGCLPSLLRLLAIFHVLSSGMHIFKHFYLLTLASRVTLPSVFGVKCKSCSTGISICWSLLR